MYSATLHYIRINKCILQCKTHYVFDCSEYTTHYRSRNRRRTQPRSKSATLGKAKPVPSISHTRILLPSDPASQASYFPVIQQTNLLGLSREFCPVGSPRQAVHISRASHPIYTPQTIVASLQHKPLL